MMAEKDLAQDVVLYPFWNKDRPNSSQVWDHFGFKKDNLDELDKSTVYCKYCLRPMDYKHKGQTTNMISHLKAHHPEAKFSSRITSTYVNTTVSTTKSVQVTTESESTTENKVNLYPFWAKDKPHASNVWEHFGFKKGEGDELDKSKAYCKFCLKCIVYNKNTSNMRSHLAHHHPWAQAKSVNIPTSRKPKLKRSYDDLDSSTSEFEQDSETNTADIVIKSEIKDLSFGDVVMPDVTKLLTGKSNTDKELYPSSGVVKNRSSNTATSTKPLAAIVKAEYTSFPQKKARSSSYKSNEREKHISSSISKFLALDMVDVQFIHGQGFKQMISTLDPTYNLKKEEIYEDKIEDMYMSKEKKIKIKLKDIKSGTITVDQWANSSVNAEYLSIYFQFITQSWKVDKVALSTVQVQNSQESITESLQNVLASWNLLNVPLFGVCGQNDQIQNALKSLDVKTTDCFGDILNHAAISSLSIPQVVTALNNTKETCHYFSSNRTLSEFLSSFNNQACTSKSEVQLPNFLAVCWTDLYTQIRQILKYEKSLKQIFDECSLTQEPGIVSETDWNILNEVVLFLKLLKQVTESLCAEGNPTASSIIPILHQLQEMTEICPTDTDVLREMKECTRNTIGNFTPSQQNLDGHPSKHILLIATVLDPRFKSLWFLSSKEQSELFKYLVEAASNIFDRQAEEDSINEQNKQETDESEKADSPKGLAFLFSKKKPKLKLSNTNGPKMEVETYREEDQLEMDEDPFKWWKSKETFYPTLSQLALQYLSLPACSLPPKLLFTKAGEVYRNKCLVIPSEVVEKRLFLYHNLS